MEESVTVSAELQSIWAPNRGFLRRLLISLSRDIDLADDLLQDTYIRALEGFAGYKGGDPKAWLATIAKSAFYTHVRRKRYLCEQLPLTEDLQEPAPGPGSNSHLNALAVHRAMSSLTPELRTALVMRHYAGLSYDEIATRTNCAVGTAKWRVSAAAAKLGAILRVSADRADAACRVGSDVLILDYLYSALDPRETDAFENHISKCAYCRSLTDEFRSVMRSLDVIEGDQKMMHIVEINKRGFVKLYLTFSRTNRSDLPQETTWFYTGKRCRLLHWMVQGEEPEYRQWTDTNEPNRVDYEAQLPAPVPPGGKVEELVVFRMNPDDYFAQRVDDGYHFEWVQRPSDEDEFAFIQVVRIPPRAKLTKADPEPREIKRRAAHTSAVWVTVLAPGQAFRCAVDYNF